MDGFHEAIPVWERAYAVSKTKKCVEGAAGTRGADETITEGLFVTLPVNSNDQGLVPLKMANNSLTDT